MMLAVPLIIIRTPDIQWIIIRMIAVKLILFLIHLTIIQTITYENDLWNMPVFKLSV